MGRSGAVFPQTAFWSIFKNRRIPTFSMGDYPRRGWNSINSHGLCGRKAMDCEIRDFSRENSRGFRNSLTSPGRKQPAWRFRLGLPSVPKRGGGSLLALATPLRSVNTADATLRIGTISQAHTITRWACVVFMVGFAPSASGLDEIGPQRRYEMAHWTISLTRRACFVILSASPAVFSASGLDTIGPQRRYQTPQWGCLIAPPLNLSWRQAS